jgi:hypothetical protein
MGAGDYHNHDECVRARRGSLKRAAHPLRANPGVSAATRVVSHCKLMVVPPPPPTRRLAPIVMPATQVATPFHRPGWVYEGPRLVNFNEEVHRYVLRSSLFGAIRDRCASARGLKTIHSILRRRRIINVPSLDA